MGRAPPSPLSPLHPLQDFHLPLVGGPTEQELIERRAAEYEAAEARRRVLLAQEEDR